MDYELEISKLKDRITILEQELIVLKSDMLSKPTTNEVSNSFAVILQKIDDINQKLLEMQNAVSLLQS